MNCGVYVILNKLTGTRYFGSSVNLKYRLRRHRLMLSLGRHINRHLQAAWSMYGEDCFGFEIIECAATREAAIRREQFYLDVIEDKYNISPCARGPFRAKGYKMSAETRRRMSVAQCRSREHPSQARLAAYHAPRSEETRRKIAAKKIGTKLSHEHKAAFMSGPKKWRETASPADIAWSRLSVTLGSVATKTRARLVAIRCSSIEDAQELVGNLDLSRARKIEIRPLVRPPREKAGPVTRVF